MNNITRKYDLLINKLNRNEKKYIHFNSLKNFIEHVDEIESNEEKTNCINLLSNYIDFIENNINEIDKLTADFYVNYIYIIAENYYIKKGFKETYQLRYNLYICILFDILIDVFLFHYPYPILTTIVSINYFVKRKKNKGSSKLFGMYY